VFLGGSDLRALALATGSIFISGLAMAQTYDPKHPVCIEITEWGGRHIDCRYDSIAQCKATASGHGAHCFANPYFAHRARSPHR
jgi:hypothetical protein